MPKMITFAELEALLLEVGFEESPTTGNHKLFEHLISDTIVVLPMWQATDRVDRAHLVATRKTLDGRGVIDAAAFDEFLETHSKANGRQVSIA